MTRDEVETLLYDDEGTTLDFKRDQYPFEGANKEEKSEILKDIIAFANAHRTTTAYILIGVDDVKGGRSMVVGVSEHLDDAKLQQFVNEKTQRPITFSYREAEHDGKPIGIIEVPVQQGRPIFSTVNFGIVQKQQAYIRHGSATAIAGPDEIGLMHSAQQPAAPKFNLTPFDRSTETPLAQPVTLHSTWLEVPKSRDIPDYEQSGDVFGFGSMFVNRDYYRKLKEFTQAAQFLQPVSLSIRNGGSMSAEDVRLVFEIEDAAGRFVFSEECDLPRLPKPVDSTLHRFDHLPMILDRDIMAEKTGDTWRIEGLFGKIQPHATVKLENDLLIGSMESGPLHLDGLIYADNMAPAPVTLDIEIEAASKPASLDDIIAIEDERFRNSEEFRLAMEDDD